MEYDSFTTLGVALDQGVAFVTLDHGELNLMDVEMLRDIDHAMRAFESDPDVRVIVLQSANPDFFVAHADLNTVSALPAEPEPREEKLGWIHAVFDRLRTTPKVTIAKIAGRCRGGGSELALACDMRFAALGKGVLGQPEVGVGIIPGAGGTVRLPALVGRARALEIMLGCGDIAADIAERYGYVNRALPPQELDYYVDSLARRIAGFPTEAVSKVKQMVATAENDFPDLLAQEEKLFLQAVHSEPAEQRMAAAMAGGMQQAWLEKCCFTHIWGALAD